MVGPAEQDPHQPLSKESRMCQGVVTGSTKSPNHQIHSGVTGSRPRQEQVSVSTSELGPVMANKV